MKMKTMAIGLIAAAAIALGVASGASAQSGTTVQLDDGPCTAEILPLLDIDFGTFAWNGVDKYELIPGTEGNKVLSFKVQTPHTANCTVTISEGNMKHEEDPTKIINVDYQADANFGPDNPLILPFTGFSSGERSVFVVIGSTLNNAYIPGEYSGTILISGQSSS